MSPVLQHQEPQDELSFDWDRTLAIIREAANSAMTSTIKPITTTIVDLSTGLKSAVNSTIAPNMNPSFDLNTNSSDNALNEMANSNRSTIFGTGGDSNNNMTGDNNNTILMQDAVNVTTTTLTTTTTEAASFSSTAMDTMTTTLTNLNEEMGHHIGSHQDGDDYSEDGHKLYIVLGVVLLLVILVIIGTFVYIRCRIRRNARSGEYCVANFKEMRNNEQEACA